MDDREKFQYLKAHPDQSTLFDLAMTAKAHGDMAGIIPAYDYSSFEHIADIGEGLGHLLRGMCVHSGSMLPCFVRRDV